jgi:alpha-L-arabinofuranosidase
MYKNKFFVALVNITVIFCNLRIVAAAQINVYYNQELGQVNNKIFGNNFLGYDPMTYEDWSKEYYGYSDFGAGIWDPKQKHAVKETIDLAKGAGITIARFPGGCGTHHYNWKTSIGKERKHFLYGLDEFLKTCDEIKADPIITLSYFEGNENDAADLVEYLNISDDGKHKWAAERAKNGHSKSYNVKYFEIGNEDWHGDHR